MKKTKINYHPLCLPVRVEESIKKNPYEIEPWRIFKIMAEFVSGFEFLKQYGLAATFFGTARCKVGSKVYREAVKLAKKLAKDDFTVITGGGPGVMEAANRGAKEENGKSVGINIKLPEKGWTERRNQFVSKSQAFDYFFVRKVMLAFASEVYIFFPGGFGTLDELFEMLTLVQTKKIDPIPIVLVDKNYWSPLLKWLDKQLYSSGYIKKEDQKLFHLADSADDAYKYILKLKKEGKIEDKVGYKM